MAKKTDHGSTLGSCEKCGRQDWKKPKLIQYDNWKERFSFERPDWPEDPEGNPHTEALEIACTCGHRAYRPTVDRGGARV
jgi:hypothetical protein